MSDVIVTSHWLVLLRPAGAGPVLYSLATAAGVTGVHADMLRHYCRSGLLGEDRADPENEPVFDDAALYAVRRIERLRRHHGVNLRALPLVCSMADEIERLRGELRFLRDR